MKEADNSTQEVFEYEAVSCKKYNTEASAKTKDTISERNKACEVCKTSKKQQGGADLVSSSLNVSLDFIPL